MLLTKLLDLGILSYMPKIRRILFHLAVLCDSLRCGAYDTLCYGLSFNVIVICPIPEPCSPLPLQPLNTTWPITDPLYSCCRPHTTSDPPVPPTHLHFSSLNVCSYVLRYVPGSLPSPLPRPFLVCPPYPLPICYLPQPLVSPLPVCAKTSANPPPSALLWSPGAVTALLPLLGFMRGFPSHESGAPASKPCKVPNKELLPSGPLGEETSAFPWRLGGTPCGCKVPFGNNTGRKCHGVVSFFFNNPSGWGGGEEGDAKGL